MRYRYWMVVWMILCSFTCLGQQEEIAIGGWRAHNNYSRGVGLETINNELFYAGRNVLLRVDLSQNSVHRIDKVSGLSDVGIMCIAETEKPKTIIIGYENGNIDIYQSGFVRNLPDILRKSINGDKTIYAIACKDQYAYLACGFGIVVVDVKKLNIKDSWYTQINNQTYPIKDVAIRQDTIFAMSDHQIFKSALTNSRIRDFSTWQTVAVANPTQDFKKLETFKDRVYLLCQDTFHDPNGGVFPAEMIYALLPNDTAFRKDTTFNFPIELMRSCQNHFIVGTYPTTIYYTMDATSGHLVEEKSFDWISSWQAIVTGDKRYFMSDRFSLGLIEATASGRNFIGVTGPERDAISSMDWRNGKLIVTHNIVPNITWTYNHGFVSSYQNNNWDFSENKQKWDFFDITKALVAPYDPSVMFVASYMFGLVKAKNDVAETIYDASNSPIVSHRQYDSNLKITPTLGGDIAFDKQNNLWFSLYGGQDPIYILTPDGKWHIPNHTLLTNSNRHRLSTKFFVDSRGWIWIIFDRNNKLLLYNTNKTPAVSDDVCIELSKSSTEPTDNFTSIYCIAEDRDSSTIWFGTDKGIKVFYSAQRLFENRGAQPQPIKVTNVTETDTIVELLLGWSTIKCITVDYGNRKWVGTDNSGVYLLSADGKEEILHFTTQNSPLPSDNTQAICIDGETGEVYFGTDKGLVSFRYTATAPREDYSEIKIFPNPVRPGYNGYISISGLKENSEVKITDARGNIAYRIKSNGGTAVWDGVCFNGAKAATGVYFVFICDADGKTKKAGKILFVN